MKCPWWLWMALCVGALSLVALCWLAAAGCAGGRPVANVSPQLDVPITAGGDVEAIVEETVTTEQLTAEDVQQFRQVVDSLSEQTNILTTVNNDLSDNQLKLAQKRATSEYALYAIALAIAFILPPPGKWLRIALLVTLMGAAAALFVL
ncbi:unnamed protein product [marine sediment metagenome]|uniref:Uncharacterized protein n=1 Tax=marine sediment metagenome TaxID=412755 RepID=X1H8G1_9ZZZZ